MILVGSLEECLSPDRATAKLLGQGYYFTGKPCRNGHLDKRHTASGHCVSCDRKNARDWREKNPEEAKRHYRLHYSKDKDRSLDQAAKQRKVHASRISAYVSERRARKLQAIPGWFDKSLARRTYEDAEVLTKLTGFMWHVDHILPLRGKTVSGLHVHTNLQVIDATTNQKKSNSFDTVLAVKLMIDDLVSRGLVADRSKVLLNSLRAAK